MCKMREEFEEWVGGRYAMAYNADGSYYIDSTADAWEVWQASRATLVIELPKVTEFCAADGAYYVLERCKGVIEGAGVKVKL